MENALVLEFQIKLEFFNTKKLFYKKEYNISEISIFQIIEIKVRNKKYVENYLSMIAATYNIA